jgi:hypothetical protein
LNSSSKFKFKLGNRENGMENKIEKKTKDSLGRLYPILAQHGAVRAAQPSRRNHGADRWALWVGHTRWLTLLPSGPWPPSSRVHKLSPCHWRVGPARQGRFFPVNLARVALSSPQWPISSPWNPRPLGLNPRGATLLTLAHLLGISSGPFHRQTSTECR